MWVLRQACRPWGKHGTKTTVFTDLAGTIFRRAWF
jgi:hypothetical protein